MRSRFPFRPAVRRACVKMAASLPHTLLRRVPNLLRSSYGVQVPLRTLCTKGPPEEGSPSSLPLSPYENEPWKYLDSEEYQNRYGSRPIWADYRRNHKGGVPPQQTRKTCIRKNKVTGNPCPICRDHKLHVDFRVSSVTTFPRLSPETLTSVLSMGLSVSLRRPPHYWQANLGTRGTAGSSHQKENCPAFAGSIRETS
ncbi:28S ribosomal protein S18b, mitochondrial isoform X3 [Peromyscus californicus insignis]|uniref:28S ribosomal protein S18b, mitochondrial isoform X3 n=1 Tax=Peromyscus californicus insignis TaxID=564181 RepID=UPI0022A6E54A|nr:28S ribosomal protein S18b, mitochondrial isoform X3 [Peromyscus californicus insignis]